VHAGHGLTCFLPYIKWEITSGRLAAVKSSLSFTVYGLVARIEIDRPLEKFDKSCDPLRDLFFLILY